MRKPEDIKIGDKTLAEVLENHKHWWNEDCDGWRDMRAYLRGADLSVEHTSVEHASVEHASVE